MQRFTAKEVKPSPGENKPTIIKTEDGSSLSGFQSSLKDMKPGAVFECETEIKKGYVNVKGEPVIIQAGTGAQTQAFAVTENGYKKEDPAKTASIETMNAITNVMTAITHWQGPENPPAKLVDLFDRALAWCDSRIPLPGKDTHTKDWEALIKGAPEPAKTGQESGGVTGIEGPPFANAGDFWTKAKKRWGKSQTEFVTILEFNSARDLTNFDLAWDILVKKLDIQN